MTPEQKAALRSLWSKAVLDIRLHEFRGTTEDPAYENAKIVRNAVEAIATVFLGRLDG